MVWFLFLLVSPQADSSQIFTAEMGIYIVQHFWEAVTRAWSTVYHLRFGMLWSQAVRNLLALGPVKIMKDRP